MTELSPAAQAVLDASLTAFWRPLIDTPVLHNKSIAAALRAAADGWRVEVAGITQTDFIRGVLRGADALEEIADELEGQ